MKRFALSVFLILTLVLAAVVVWRLSNIVFLVLASLAIAAAARGPLEWLLDRHIPRGLALLAVYGSILLLVAIFGYLLYRTLGRELGSVTEDLSHVYRTLAVRWGGAAVQNLPALTARLPTPEQMGQLLAKEDLPALLRGGGHDRRHRELPDPGERRPDFEHLLDLGPQALRAAAAFAFACIPASAGAIYLA